MSSVQYILGSLQKAFILSVLVLLLSSLKSVDETDVISPDGLLKMVLSTNSSLSYRIVYKGDEIINPSSIALVLSDKIYGENAKIRTIRKRYVNNVIAPLYGKFNKLDDCYNETTVIFDQDYSLVLRAYNDGVAFRFVSDTDNEIIIKDEIVEINIAGDPSVILPETDNYTTWEVMYIDYDGVAAVNDGKKSVTPVLFSTPEGINIVVAESDVRDYPGMYLEKNESSFRGNFAQYPDSSALGSWGFVSVVQRTRDYIAKTSGRRAFPWRVFVITDDDKSLLTNELVYKLASPSVLENVSWIKPGKATWEWWHDAILTEADIPSGMDNRNTALYKHYIDFAAEYNLEYLMIDAGWSHIFDLSKVNPKVDIHEIISYAKSKNVGVFLWCTAMSLTSRDDEFLKMMSDWGAVGIKVDFFDRDDQLAMNWYETIACKAAAHKLMVNFHGCSKPTGLQRTFPNIVNFEAVRGAECSKWDLTASPQHHVTFPFIRMLAGPIDYTPGGMRNRSPQLFKPIDSGLPLVQGTRCHQLAMFVIFDQYFAMLSDSPSEYRKYPDIMKFLSDVPVTFDNTIVLDAKVGEYILIAKQKGDEWYIGAMTNHTARMLTVDFGFLTKGVGFKADLYKDSKHSNLYANQYLYETMEIDSKTVSNLKLASGGGFVFKLSPMQD